MQFIDKQSPFAIYESGSGYVLPNVLPQRARFLLTQLGRKNPDELMPELRRAGRQTLERTTSFESAENLWDFFLAEYLTPRGHDTPLLSRRIEGLDIMLSAPAAGTWPILKNWLTANIDELSGWTGSMQEMLAQHHGVWRGDDGEYYQDASDGKTIYKVTGARTLAETRLDFLTEQLAREFGTVRHFLNFFSLIAIAEDYSEHTAMYPRSLKAILIDRQWPSIEHKWRLLQYHPSRTVVWRPFSNVCDPQWLAGDLLGGITDTFLKDPFPPTRVPEGSENLLGAEYERQADFAMDTNLRIGKEESIILTFRGREFRWINASLESDTRISVGLRVGEDMSIAEQELNRFLSIIAWSHGATIAKKSGPIVTAKRSLPAIISPRSIFAHIIEPRYLFSRIDPVQIGPKEELILAKFREALNARSVFYAFLNYWNIIEAIFPKQKVRFDWVDKEAAASKRHQKRVAEIQAADSEGVAHYLDYSCRSAVVHVFRQPFVDPDSGDDFMRLRKDLEVVISLAKAAIDTLPAFGGPQTVPSMTRP
jgi:hypothetical protein